MSDAQIPAAMQARLRELHLTGSETTMGKLLRKFWQPVALSATLETRLM